MNEKDLAHLRFLTTRVMYGDSLNRDELNFVQDMQRQIIMIHNAIDEVLHKVRIKEEEL